MRHCTRYTAFLALALIGLIHADAQTNPVYSYTVPSGGYDPVGNVTSFTDSVNGSWTLGYDSINRVSIGSATAGPYRGLALGWSYDSFGNRLSQSASGTPPTAGTFARAASYDVNNRLTRTETSVAVNYDASGNLTSDGVTQVAYDAEGRVCATYSSVGASGITQYIYNAEGQRVAKGHPANSSNVLACADPTNFTATATYVLGPSGEQMTELNGQGGWQHTNVFAGGRLLATYDTHGLHLPLTDPLGTVRVQASGDGTTEETCSSLPFGDVQNCTMTSITQEPTEHHFTGKERDAESGLDNFGPRYYASSMGRFMSPDPVFATVDRLMDPQQWNMYSYVRNNPLSLTDPTGLDFNLSCSGGNTATCQGGLQGQTVDGKFQATDVDMNKQGDPSAGYSDQFGNNYTGTFDQNNGVSFTNTDTGATSSNSRFIDGSDQTTVNGSGSLFGGTQGVFNSNCGGSCEAKGSLFDQLGHAGAVANAEKMIGKSFEDNLNFFGGHGKSTSYRTGEDQLTHIVVHAGGPTELHFEGHPPGRDLVNFVLHQVDAIHDLANHQSSKEPKLP